MKILNPKPVQKRIRTLKSSWYVWVFPLFAILITGWLFMDYFRQQGSEIKISFEDGTSLQADKTRLRFRGVTIGVVKAVSISEDGKDVLATVALQNDAQHFAVEGSKFWVVSPKVNLQGITGLETILDGTYIAAQPGPQGSSVKRDFNGKLERDNSSSLEGTVAYYLEARNVESVGPGDLVTFRGLAVGSVTKVNLSKTAQTAIIQINVQNKFVRLIRTNTVFWRKVAVQADMGLFSGAKIKINSLETMLRGGIDFFTPDNPGEIANADSHFTLSPAAPKDYEKWNPQL